MMLTKRDPTGRTVGVSVQKASHQRLTQRGVLNRPIPLSFPGSREVYFSFFDTMNRDIQISTVIFADLPLLSRILDVSLHY